MREAFRLADPSSLASGGDMRLPKAGWLPLTVVPILAACAPPPARTGQSGASGESVVAQSAAPKTIVFGVRYELQDIIPKITTGTTSDGAKRLFSASLAYMDGKGDNSPVFWNVHEWDVR